jgi:hypothetical protein
MGYLPGGGEMTVAIRYPERDQARSELLKISEKYGFITPEKVVEEATDEESPIHGYFKWDDAEAGNLFRINQARFLIRTVKLDIVRVGTGGKEISFETTRAFVSPPSIRGENSYVPLQVAMDDTAMRDDLLERAKADLIALKRKYKKLFELSKVWDVIETL